MIPLDRLIVIAGPSCCGKSTFINRLKNGELTDIAAALHMGDVATWVYADSFYMNKKVLKDLERSPTREMVLHWTLPHPTIKLALRNFLIMYAYEKKERLTLLRSASDLAILTLYTSQHSFVQRVQSRRKRVKERRKDGVDNLFKYSKKMWYTRQLEKFYSDIGNLTPLYDRWFRFCHNLNAKESYLVNLENDPKLVHGTKWLEIREHW